ncbi:HPr kinase/phosphorylase [Candidatus Methylomirabilis lanthanidiphila]|uniref:HPr kinase/phosphorylase n=1 Tax=Candidatus Methylomirabilis lanthanidiphila TaxID=2211376 RepID=A0A564ZKW6_9BACT|nr:HPr kinase/phosphorylase [Candidatus Methylomirabilis lanthanidiphila]
MNSMITQTFDLYGIGVQVDTEIPLLAAGIGDLLRRFARDRAADSQPLRFIYERSGKAPDPLTCGSSNGAGSLLFSTSWKNAFDLAGRLGIDWDVYTRDGGLLLDYHRRGRLWLDTSGGRLEGLLAEPLDLHQALLPSIFFFFPFAQLLARRGLHVVHAAALERNGCGVLIPGMSGSGKSTCCVSLMRAGYRCLSDDKPFLRKNGGDVELLPFPEMIDVTDQSVAFFPELSRAATALETGFRKKRFCAETLYPGSAADAVAPSVILFPNISGEPTSRVETLSKAQALRTLLPHSLLCFDRGISVRHFELLARLVETTTCYRLHFGRDVLDLPRLVDRLLG